MTLKIEKGLAVKEYNNGGTEEKALLEKFIDKIKPRIEFTLKPI